jgi:hypothetical protein
MIEDLIGAGDEEAARATSRGFRGGGATWTPIGVIRIENR